VTAEDKALIEQLPLRAAPSQAASPTAVTGALQVALRPQSHYDLPPLRAKEVRYFYYCFLFCNLLSLSAQASHRPPPIMSSPGPTPARKLKLPLPHSCSFLTCISHAPGNFSRGGFHVPATAPRVVRQL
jgi:hypothetical protein